MHMWGKNAAWAVTAAAAMLLLAGCGRPAPLSGGPVDVSVQREAMTAAAQTPVAAASKPTVEAQAATAAEASKPAGEAQAQAASAAEASKPASGAQVQAATAAAEASKPAGGAQAQAASAAAEASKPAVEAQAQAATAAAEAGKPAVEAQAQAASAAEAGKPAGGAQAQAATAAASAAKQQTEPVNIVKQANGPSSLTFQELYSDVTVRGIKLSDKVNKLAGKKVEMVGYMAPPLTARVNFFVLTKVAMNICPFCSTDADWPTDIVVVFMPKGKDIPPTEHPVKVTGTLSVGSQTDDATGFVSLIRINADKVEVLK